MSAGNLAFDRTMRQLSVDSHRTCSAQGVVHMFITCSLLCFYHSNDLQQRRNVSRVRACVCTCVPVCGIFDKKLLHQYI